MKTLFTLMFLVIIFTPRALWGAPAAHLVISEVKVSGPSGSSTDEFVELYNPTDTPVDLTGWSLVKRTASGAKYPLVTAFENITLPPHGYVLVAHPTGYIGSVIPDVRYDTTNSLASDNSVEVVNGSAVVDLVGWGSATHVESIAAPTPGSAKSIERKALPSSTGETLTDGGEDAFRGNGEDTDHNDQDWVSRSVPEPQSLASELEFVTAAAPAPSSVPAPATTSSAPPTVSTPTAAPAMLSPHHVVLSEFLPDPVGPDGSVEFIELHNAGDVAVDLRGWRLNDSSKVSYTFTSATISAGGWLVVKRSESGVALNNTGGETVTLTAPDGVVTSTVAWQGTAPEGQSFALVASTWQWTRQLTPGKANVYEDPNRAPVAVIRDMETTVRVRALLTFSAADSSDPDGDDLEFRWSFSDGSKATGTTVKHSFAKPGAARVTLTALDPKGKQATATHTLTVQAYDASDAVTIVAVMPNPAEGDDEWVELQNASDRTVDLAGWSLRFGKKVTALEGPVAARATRRWSTDYLRFALRNDGGTLELLNAENHVVSALTYTKAQRGVAVTPDTPTPKATNSGAPQATAGTVAGAAVAKAVNSTPLEVPQSDELPAWVWLAVAASALVVWGGYAAWHRRRHATLPEAK